ncbi:MAG: LysE family transporter [Candidatus Odinarchaeota archaeon]
MIDIIIIWISIATLSITLTAPLGPVNVEMIRNSMSKVKNPKIAFFSTTFIGIGAMLGDFIIALSALTLGGELLTDVFSDPLIKLLLFLISIIILVYLGLITLFKEPVQINSTFNQLMSASTEISKPELRYIVKDFARRYITGFLLVVASPWSYLWWVSAGTIILFSDFNVPDFFSRFVLILMFLSGIFIWVLIFSAALVILGRIPNPKFFNWITKGSAFVLLFFAGIIAIDAWKILPELISLFFT